MIETLMPADMRDVSDLGRRAAEGIFLHGADPSSFHDPFLAEFAEAAIRRFAELHAARPKVYDQVFTGARRSASSQSEDKYQGINEVIQNADDQRASWLRIGFLEAEGGTWALFAHDGARVDVGDVLPMALPFLSTKIEEAEATGRFGIGLKTLDRLGDRLEVHARPYHFAVANNDLHLATGWPAVPGLHDPDAEETLVCLRLTSPHDREGISTWIESFDPSSLLFLRSVRCVSLVSPSGEVVSEHRLLASTPKRLSLRSLPDPVDVVESLGLRTPGGDRRWTRYTWKVKVPTGYSPRHKAAPDYSAVSLALPHTIEPGQLFVWLPTPQRGWLPFHVNADFEPTENRESILDTQWNGWLIDRLGDLATAVAQSRLEKRPRSAWRAVPLIPKQPQGYAPRVEEALETITRRLHESLASHLELPIGGHNVAVGRLVYEAPALAKLVEPSDLEELSPDRIALPSQARDKDGAWRKVLAVVPGARELSVAEALKMLAWTEDRLGLRQPSFFVGMAEAALDAGLGRSLPTHPCILTSGLLRVRPSASAKELLVREQGGDGLAFRLGLAHAIHPEYLHSNSASTKVRDWLEKNGYLTPRPTPARTLSALQAKASDERVELDVDALRLLRDELAELGEQREKVGRGIGALVWVDGFTYENGGRSRQKVQPGDAYQPKSIDKQEQQLSWAQAAGETPGLKWIDSKYAESLAARQRRLGSGPSAFFRLLGARTAPRIEPSPGTLEVRGSYAYSTTGRTLPPFQREAIENLRASVEGLTGDRVSPDLEAVCRDIAATQVSPARALRARALIHAINRQWPDYRARLLATAVYAYYILRQAGRVPATWIADLASVQWMSSQAGEPSAPRDLVLDTAETRLVFGDGDQRFAAEVDESIDELFLRSLGLELSPSSNDIVDQLQGLRDESQKGRPIDEELPGRLYRVLANRIQSQKARRGDLSPKQLRAKFGIDRERPGLIYAGGRWYSPNAVLLEPPIFKTRRPFAPDRTALRPLWHTLGIRPPSIADCLDVLQEIAVADPGPDEEAILLDTYRHLEDLIPHASKREQVELSRLPLWTTDGWRTTVPVYAVQQAPDLRGALGAELATWQHDAPLQLPNLVAVRSVTVLARQQFEPSGLSREALLKSDALDGLFTLAVGHLREILASRDPGAYERLRTGWKALEAARVWRCPDLRLRTTLWGGVVDIGARAHVIESTPVEVFFATEEDAGTDAVGGAVIASLFADPPAGIGIGIDFMWQCAWFKAKSGEKPRGIRLAERDDSPEPETEAQAPRGAKPDRSSSRKTAEGGQEQPGASTQTLPAPQPSEPRNLKDFSKAQVARVGLSGEDGSAGNVHRRKRSALQDNPQPEDTPARPGGKTYPNYTAEQREDAGVAALRIVLAAQGRSLNDMRPQHGVGSDLGDDLGKYYELKVHGGEIPDEVSLEDSQLERALREGKNFVLAVVGGVEQGENTVVKLIENPAERLNLRASNKLSLFGVKTKKGQEFEIITGNPTA